LTGNADRSTVNSGLGDLFVAPSVLGDEGLQFADELGVSPECKIRLQACLEGTQPLLLQPRRLGSGEGHVGELRQRLPAPQLERLAQRACGPGRRRGAAPS
jgi:hypothetical protein